MSFIDFFRAQVPLVLSRLKVIRLELNKVQHDIERILIIEQNMASWKASELQHRAIATRTIPGGNSMKLFFLLTEDKIRQVSTLNKAACLRYLGEKDCRLFRFDTVSTNINEIAIPSIEFGEGCIGD